MMEPPKRLHVGRGESAQILFFDRIAPITGDAIYERVDEKTGAIVRYLLPNVNAREKQAVMFGTW